MDDELRSWHTCTYYCHGGAHVVLYSTDRPDEAQESAVRRVQGALDALHVPCKVIRVFPARETGHGPSKRLTYCERHRHAIDVCGCARKPDSAFATYCMEFVVVAAPQEP